MSTRKTFSNATALIKAALAYPRPVTINEEYVDGVEFAADDGASFVISRDEFLKTCADSSIAKNLSKSLDTQAKRYEYCESLNYGKPDWDQGHIEPEPKPDDAWIEINLPWSKHVDLPFPDYPIETVEALIKERFGQTIDELENAFEAKHGKFPYDAYNEEHNKLENETFKKYYGYEPEETDDLSDEQYEQYRKLRDEQYDAQQKEISERLASSTDPIMVELNTLKALKKAINDFQDDLPEVIKWAAECDRIQAQAKEEEKKVSFYASDLRRPGVLIEVQEQEVRQYLIGDINAQGGVCDDCMGFSREAIVLRAKVLIPER